MELLSKYAREYVAGQLCIVHTIKAFGPLAVAAVMTTRQFLSVLLSCAIFAHPLTGGQWYALPKKRRTWHQASRELASRQTENGERIFKAQLACNHNLACMRAVI